jgi:hypothetical protein
MMMKSMGHSPTKVLAIVLILVQLLLLLLLLLLLYHHYSQRAQSKLDDT